MANIEHKNTLKKGSSIWNLWRNNNPQISPDLSDINFITEFPNTNENYNLPKFINYNFKNSNFRKVSLRNITFINCNFDDSYLHFSDLVDAYFESCSFNNVGMRVCKIGAATFSNCIFNNSDLSYSSAVEANFTGSTFNNSKLEQMSLINCNFSESILTKCRIYGISSWDLITTNSKHSDLVITKEDQPTITVDKLELAQFIYMIINRRQSWNYSS